LLITVLGRGIFHYYHFVKNVLLWGAACDPTVVERVGVSDVTGVFPCGTRLLKDLKQGKVNFPPHVRREKKQVRNVQEKSQEDP